VSKVALKSGKELPCDMVIAGVGAKPTGDMYKGQLDFIEERPGGIKVCTAGNIKHDWLWSARHSSGKSRRLV